MRFFPTLIAFILGVVSFATCQTSRRLQREAEHMAPSLTAPARLAPGEPARYLGRLEPGGRELRSRDRDRPCVAYRTRVIQVTEDSDDHEYRYLILDERRGPPYLLVRGELGHVAIALGKWVNLEKASTRRSRHLPSYREVSFRRPRTEGSTTGYEIEELVLVAGQRLFVAGIAGRLWDAAAPESDAPAQSAKAPVRELLEDPVLGRVEVFPGDQRERITGLSRRARLHQVGSVLTGIGAALSLVFLVVAVIRRW